MGGGGGGEERRGAYNRTKKVFQNKLHRSADQSTYFFFILNLIGFLSFKMSQIIELISIQARNLGELITGCTFVYR